MNIIPGEKPTRLRLCLLTMTVMALLACGCHKTQTATAPTAPTASTDSSQPAQPAPVASNPSSPSQPAVATTPTTTPDGQPDLGALNRSLLRWVMGNRRPPANFADFAATAGVTIPPPPAGKKYVITKNMHIQLVAE